MGLQVATSFDTPHGFTVVSVYIRVVQVLLSSLTSAPTAIVMFEPVVSREKRGASPLTVPAMPTSVTFQAPIVDCIRFEVLYAYIRRDLESRGFVCTPILEEGQTLVEYTIPATQPVVESPPDAQLVDNLTNADAGNAGSSGDSGELTA